MRIVRYRPDIQEKWDEFIKSSRNGTFLFERGYMDYHSDRFRDHSLMYWSDKGRLLSVMPANEVVSADGTKVLHSHQGLTYGGFVLAPETRMAQVMDIFEGTVAYLKGEGFREWYYKQVPVCYHRIPSQEDEYALWRLGAEIVGCGVASDLMLNESCTGHTHIIGPTKNYYLGKLKREGYYVERNASIKDFWPILADSLLKNHNAFPVHTFPEMRLLQSRFPAQIECVLARNYANEIEAGVVLYKMKDVVHTQYMAPSSEGRKNHVMDFLILALTRQLCDNGIFRLIDFGTSMKDRGEFLNEGLISQKEDYGGRGVVYKQYRIKV